MICYPSGTLLFFRNGTDVMIRSWWECSVLNMISVPKSIKIGISQVFESDVGHLSSVAGKIGFVKLMLFRRLMICFNHRMTIIAIGWQLRWLLFYLFKIQLHPCQSDRMTCPISCDPDPIFRTFFCLKDQIKLIIFIYFNDNHTPAFILKRIFLMLSEGHLKLVS